jgi:glycosyltransferase involved in cell wall biosynthesis
MYFAAQSKPLYFCMKKNLSFIIPAFNEEANIREMIADAMHTLETLDCNYEIVVVDDGSSDNTATIVKEISARHTQVRLIKHERNQGYGAAVFTGLTNATKDLVFFTDSDRQFDLNELEKMLPMIETADLTVGYRAPRRDTFMRKLNGWGWSKLVTLLFGYTARDIDCAFKLMRRNVIQKLQNEIKSRGATFSAEFLVRAKYAGFRINEAAIEGHRPRVAGSPTGAKPAVIIRAFKELFFFRLTLWQEVIQLKQANVNGEIALTGKRI